mgnify:CR=1 FL=1
MKLLHMLMLAGSATVIAAAFSVREFPVDFWFLLFGGIVLLGATLMVFAVDGFGPFRSKSPIVAGAMLISFGLLYPTALALGIRFFFTPVTGFPRAVYLLASLAGLSPLIMIAFIGMVFVIGKALR